MSACPAHGEDSAGPAPWVAPAHRPSTRVKGRMLLLLPSLPCLWLVFVLIMTIQIYFNCQTAKVSTPQWVPSESCHAWGNGIPGNPGGICRTRQCPLSPRGKGRCQQVLLLAGEAVLHFHPTAGNLNILLCIYYNLVSRQSSV